MHGGRAPGAGKAVQSVPAQDVRHLPAILLRSRTGPGCPTAAADLLTMPGPGLSSGTPAASAGRPCRCCFRGTGLSIRKTRSHNASFTVFPNPFTSQVTVQFDQSISGEAFFELPDMNGRVIMSSAPSEIMDSYQLDMNEVVPGMYILRARTGGQVMFSTITKF